MNRLSIRDRIGMALGVAGLILLLGGAGSMFAGILLPMFAAPMWASIAAVSGGIGGAMLGALCFLVAEYV